VRSRAWLVVLESPSGWVRERARRDSYARVPGSSWRCFCLAPCVAPSTASAAGGLTYLRRQRQEHLCSQLLVAPMDYVYTKRCCFVWRYWWQLCRCRFLPPLLLLLLLLPPTELCRRISNWLWAVGMCVLRWGPCGLLRVCVCVCVSCVQGAPYAEAGRHASTSRAFSYVCGNSVLTAACTQRQARSGPDCGGCRPDGNCICGSCRICICTPVSW
jgi:hypothetical protein